RTHLVNEIAGHLAQLETSYMELHVLGNGRGARAKAFGKVFSALTYFRRSFKSRGDTGEQVMNLAIAFEVLLTPRYAKGVGKRVERRIKLALKGVKGSRRFQIATRNLYAARSKVVHEGTTSVLYDLSSGQEAFVYVFLG